jgi:hypothetical protein
MRLVVTHRLEQPAERRRAQSETTERDQSSAGRAQGALFKFKGARRAHYSSSKIVFIRSLP